MILPERSETRPLRVLDAGVSGPLRSRARVLGGELDLAGGEVSVELVARWTDLRAAGTVPVWLLRSIDGQTWEDGGAGTAPERQADVVFRMRPGTTIPQRIVLNTWLAEGAAVRVLVQNQVERTIPNTAADRWQVPTVFPPEPSLVVESLRVRGR